MRIARTVAGLAVLASLLAARPALAQDGEKEAPKSDKESQKSDKDTSDEFKPTWFGLRAEIWYQPTMSAQANVGFQGQSFHLDAHDDLGVLVDTPKPRYLDFSPGPLALEAFVDTRWLSVSIWWITPFEYHGTRIVTQTFTFFGQTFQTQTPTETDLAQSILGIDIKANLLNNRWVRLSPVVAARCLAIDWTVKGTVAGQGFEGSTEDAQLPASFGRYKLIPYPEVGAEVRAGYRDYVEADLKLTGLYFEYSGYRGTTALLEGGVTGYLPILTNVGLRIGYRYYYVSARVPNTDRQPFDFHLRIYGVTISAILRF